LFDASQSVLILHAEGKHRTWPTLLATQWVSWLPWVVATPLIIALARRYPALPRASLRTIGIHLAAFAIVSATAEAWSSLLQVLFNPWDNRSPPQFGRTWSTTLLYQALTFVIVYALILTVTFVVDSHRNLARQATEAARLNEELSNAQLAALRQQMEPHFMFNTLNSIAGLVRDQRNDAAVSMIVGLSEFLRRATDDSHRAEVTLGEEVEYLQRYLDIQKVRFGDRLQVTLNIPPDLLSARVPNLLLQPLVENAIKHGIAERVSGGVVRVSAESRDGRLSLVVYNDGVGTPRDWQASRTGVGISNLRTRLQILHGDASELLLRHADSGGAEVVVTVPFHQA
jgi:two-component system, LytTR family, sensor kinase